mgnify:CR=1 FL=1
MDALYAHLRQLPAVQQGRLYAVYHGATRSIMDAALLQYLGKTLYPDLFKDLDPAATYLGFYQRYLPIRWAVAAYF